MSRLANSESGGHSSPGDRRWPLAASLPDGARTGERRRRTQSAVSGGETSGMKERSR